MLTIIETPEFQKQAANVWSESERMDFICWLAENPLAGDVIPNANGARKVRWTVNGKGKRGGARVIYFNLSSEGALLLIAVYAKSEQTNISTKKIRKA